MTLRTDVAGLLAEAGIVDVDVDEAVADDHARTAVYLRVVSVTASSPNRDRDRAVVATILRDPDESGAKTAVVALVDEIAWEATGPDEFRQWADGLLPEIDRLRVAAFREFIRRRVQDWLFWLSAEDGHVPTAAELAEVTDWMQRHLAAWSRSLAVLAVVAGSARTRKTRNIAKNRANSREIRSG
ncbi:hypothetical protein [Streptomyces sp. Je 1-369]|uniref:hypothetical protein n=1 Tax=Streptomyces sp. Je 1-369 TaxID=2966192 RepID=UPI00228616B4|nr:hypothetical protein [Streptomyces sp. Je 1-369]WAL97958.1 hypothetical protein NOO62_27815 [Streptomyces sp. Je 1-369]